jgi:hypothetical protein
VVAECYTFPIREVRGAKRRAARAARIRDGVEPLAGTLDPTPVLESFGCLRVRPGWKLLAYLMGGGIGGESRVVAVPTEFDPVGAELAPVADPPSDADRPYSGSNLDFAVSLPLQARRRFMSAVEGDGSPWSYLCASLAVRQLLDYAAYWHALYEHDWFEHLILAKWPPPGSALQEPAGGLEGEQPSLWRPAVWVGRRSTTVRMYTYRPARANPEGVWMHEDRYEAGSYDPELTRTLIAAGRPATIQY